jgi:mannose-6-phosphate isomerase-like protein (cupin superfamily)
MTNSAVEHVSKGECLLAIIVRNDIKAEGVHFFTPNEYSQQLAYMHHKAGKTIEPHIHNPVSRKVTQTQEVLVIKSGTLRVDFYDPKRNYVESRVLSDGDVILLIQGGHGFEALEELEMLEIKQGPYLGDVDKTRFDGIRPDQVVIAQS